MSRDKKLIRLYLVLLVVMGLFFLSLFLFLSDARKLHSEGALRRPPKHPHGRGIPAPTPVAPAAPVEVHATPTESN